MGFSKILFQISWVDPGQPCTSQPVRHIHGKKALLCIWWNQKGAVYYELLKRGDKTHKVIRLHDNARNHIAKPVKTYLDNIKWDVLPHAAYSSDYWLLLILITTSDYYLFWSMQQGLLEQHFNSYEAVKNWINECLAAKDERWLEPNRVRLFFCKLIFRHQQTLIS